MCRRIALASIRGALPPRDVRHTRQPGSGPTLLRRDLPASRAFFGAIRAIFIEKPAQDRPILRLDALTCIAADGVRIRSLMDSSGQLAAVALRGHQGHGPV